MRAPFPPLAEPLEPRALLIADLPFRAWMPEGYAAPHIEEFVTLANPGDAPVDYQLWTHFESDRPSLLVYARSIPAHARAGEILSSVRYLTEPVLPFDEPYAIELRSSAPLAAGLSRYDRGAVGESFTSTPSSLQSFIIFPITWDGVGYLQDFLTWFNPGTVDANLTLTFYNLAPATSEDAPPVVLHRGAPAGKRSGLSLGQIEELNAPDRWAFWCEISSDAPIVAAYSQYETGIGATMSTGVPGAGDDEWVIPIVAPSYGPEGSGPVNLTMFNASETQDAVIDVTYTLEDGTVHEYPAARTIGPRRTYDLLMTYLDDPLEGEGSIFFHPTRGSVTVRARDGVPIQVALTEGLWNDTRDGGRRVELRGTEAQTTGATRVVLSEGYYVEGRMGVSLWTTLAVANPPSSGDAVVEVSVRLLVPDGRALAPQVFSVSGTRPLILDLETSALLADAAGELGQAQFAYAVEVTSGSPVVASMIHDDHFFGNLDGSFMFNGVPM